MTRGLTSRSPLLSERRRWLATINSAAYDINLGTNRDGAHSVRHLKSDRVSKHVWRYVAARYGCVTSSKGNAVSSPGEGKIHQCYTCRCLGTEIVLTPGILDWPGT